MKEQTRLPYGVTSQVVDWIDAREELPEAGVPVLVTHRVNKHLKRADGKPRHYQNLKVYIAVNGGNEVWYPVSTHKNNFNTAKVTHWMYFPLPPKVESQAWLEWQKAKTVAGPLQKQIELARKQIAELPQWMQDQGREDMADYDRWMKEQYRDI
jgi:Protein of unknown function (DUF551)